MIRFYPGCLYGATTYVEAFTFSIVTHMTIGACQQLLCRVGLAAPLRVLPAASVRVCSLWRPAACPRAGFSNTVVV